MGLKFLVVEDDDDIREIIKMELEAEGHKVSEAENGKVAMSFLEQNTVDFVITDLIMPEEDGLAIIPKIKKMHPSTVIIAVSGESSYGVSSYLKTASIFGAHYTVEKPFKTGAFQYIVKEHMHAA